jgi:hypothetical protein
MCLLILTRQYCRDCRSAKPLNVNAYCYVVCVVALRFRLCLVLTRLRFVACLLLKLRVMGCIAMVV